jgi:hypothetical protein
MTKQGRGRIFLLTLITNWRKHWKPIWDIIEWPLFLLLVCLTLFAGIHGFSAYFYAKNETRSWLDCFYLTLQLFTLESGAISGDRIILLEVARFLAPILSGYAAIQALLVLFNKQWLLLKLRLLKNHTIICGLGRKGYMFARDFWSKGYDVVIVEDNPANPFIPMSREAGIPVLVGNAADATLLKQARLVSARNLIAVCGEDGVNAEIAITAQAIWGERNQHTLHCYIHIVEPAVWDFLNGRKFSFDSQFFNMEFFNIYDWGAKQALQKYPLHMVSSADKPPHLLIIGLGKFGSSLLVRVARSWYWQMRDVTPRQKLRISVIDRLAPIKLHQVQMRYPCLQIACELVPIEHDIRLLSGNTGIIKTLNDKEHGVTQVFICFDSDALALHSVGILQSILDDRSISVVTRMSVESGLASLLAVGDQPAKQDLKIFHLANETCRVEALQDFIDILAQTIHEGYVEHCQVQGFYSVDRPAHKPWHELSQDLQNSNRDQAHHLPLKLQRIGYEITPLNDWDADRRFCFNSQEVETMAEMEHERWLAERKRLGWRLGIDDAARKTNPNMKPWLELDEKTREFDRNAVRLIPKLLAKIDLQVQKSS